MATNSAYIQIATSNAFQFTNASNNDLVIYPTVSSQQMLLGTSNNVYANMAITPCNINFVVQGATSASTINFNTNNNSTNAMTIAGTGNVGIGTVPYTDTRFAVNGKLGVLGQTGPSFSQQGAYLNWNPDGGSGKTQIVCQRGGGGGGFQFDNYSSSNTLVATNMLIDTNGNVGIGTISPAARLNVKSGSNVDSTGQPSGTFAAIVYNATNVSGCNGLFVKNNWGAENSTVFEAGLDYVGGGYNSYYHMTGAGNHYLSTYAKASLLCLSNTSVGVGTANPSAPLQVYNTANTGLGAVVITGGSNGTVYIGGGDVVGRMNGLVQVGDAFIAASPGSQDSGGLVLGPWTLNNKGIRINGANGNVGIGTTNPSYSLDVVGQVNCTTGYRIGAYNGYILDNNFDTSGSNRYGVHMANGVTRLFTAGAYAPSAIALSQATGTGTFIDQLYINHAGQVGVGTSTPGYLLDVNGSGHIGNTYINSTGVAIGTGGVAARSLDVLGQAGVWASYFISIPNGSLTYFINFYNNTTATTIGSISGNGTTVTYATTSDYRRKENVSVIFDPLGTLSKLKPVSYNFIGETEQVTGFIAHELQEFIPYAVTGTKDEIDADGKPVYQCVDVAKVVPLLTACAQEFNKQIQANGSHLISIQESLEEKDKRILSLERKNATLEKDLLDLKADLERVKKFLGIEYI